MTQIRFTVEFTDRKGNYNHQIDLIKEYIESLHKTKVISVQEKSFL